MTQSDDIKIYTSRPEEKRSAVEEKVYDILQELGIEYLRADHPPAASINECIDIENFINASICKNLFLTDNKKSVYYLLLIKGCKKFESGTVSKLLNSSRLSFASECELFNITGMQPGSVSVLGISNDTDCKIKVVVDSDLLQQEFIGCHPCKNTSTLKIKTCDIFNKFIPYTKHKSIIINL